MFCSRKRAVLTSKKGGTACVRALTAASVAVFVVSFISPANSQPPEIKLLTAPEVLRFQDFLTKEGYANVQIVTIAYEDSGVEKLIAFKLQGANPSLPALVPSIPSSTTPLQIPGLAAGTDFEVVFIYTGSPATVKSCSSSAGSINCRF
jgi:hypothetical protein